MQIELEGSTLEEKKKALFKHLRCTVTCECERCGILRYNQDRIYCVQCGKELCFFCPSTASQPNMPPFGAKNRSCHWKENCPYVVDILLPQASPLLGFLNQYQDDEGGVEGEA